MRNLLKQCHFAIVSSTLLVICLPAFAQNSEPYFSYMLNVLVEGDSGGGVTAPARGFSRGPHPDLITYPTPYSTIAVDCYSTNGDIPAYAVGFDPSTYGLNSCESASSFNLPLTLTTQMLGGSSANIVAGSVTSISLSMKPSAPGPSLLTAAIGNVNYAQVLSAPPGSQVNFPLSTVGTGNGFVSVAASSDCSDPTCFVSAGNTGPSQQNLQMGPLTIGPSGKYTITAQLFGSAENPGNLGAVSSITLNFCALNVTLSVAKPTPQYLTATASAPNGMAITTYAQSCGFSEFNWQQMMTSIPDPSPYKPNQPSSVNDVNPENLSPPGCLSIEDGMFCTLIAPPPFFDPPVGGWDYDKGILGADSYPFYYNVAYQSPGVFCTIPLGAAFCTADFPYILSADLTRLSYVDAPTDPCLPTGGLRPLATLQKYCGGIPAASGSAVQFSTQLVGVDSEDNVTPLFSWTWQSTFNGTSGGTIQTQSVNSIDPGSGVGNVTITSINGVQLPPVVPPDQVSATASGLAYSRVTRTFNGTVTIKNIGSSAISGPLQILCLGMTTGVTLVDATGNLSGTPYLTVPAVNSLAPGQSTTISVQFQNPSNLTINFTPVIYSGSIN